MKTKECPTCSGPMDEKGYATQLYRRDGTVVTVTGIPAVPTCPRCQNAILEFDVAQQVADLITPLFSWKKNHTLPPPIVTVVFPALEPIDL